MGNSVAVMSQHSPQKAVELRNLVSKGLRCRDMIAEKRLDTLSQQPRFLSTIFDEGWFFSSSPGKMD